ncbi:hypothetical protein [Francisella sp. 19X1-34]|uniref:hypothetical protein n=1 Tax=Francisella sp. 19X1-34 TaxID=3087177 RepID=UPI002E35B05D|nr:hypothetical protein [Francisella sp. 19X1-34]MED7787660.1 hypothetical protein [Francisella sp. 19X1-34]
MLKKFVIIFVYVLLTAKIVYALNCSFLGFEKNRVDSRLRFKCHEDTSLKDNKLMFYIIGKNVKIETIKSPEGKVDFNIDDISENIKQVSVNISIETWLIDLNYTADKDKAIELTILPKKDSNRDFKILWGGVIKNSHSSKKTKNNDFQFYRNKDDQFYVVKKGLNCYLKDDCDDNIKVSNNTCNSKNCKLLRQSLGIYADFGIIHQRNL